MCTYACRNTISDKIVFEFNSRNWHTANDYYYSIIDSVITNEVENEALMNEQGYRAARYELIIL